MNWTLHKAIKLVLLRPEITHLSEMNKIQVVGNPMWVLGEQKWLFLDCTFMLIQIIVKRKQCKYRLYGTYSLWNLVVATNFLRGTLVIEVKMTVNGPLLQKIAKNILKDLNQSSQSENSFLYCLDVTN